MPPEKDRPFRWYSIADPLPDVGLLLLNHAVVQQHGPHDHHTMSLSTLSLFHGSFTHTSLLYNKPVALLSQISSSSHHHHLCCRIIGRSASRRGGPLVPPGNRQLTERSWQLLEMMGCITEEIIGEDGDNEIYECE